MARLSTDQSGGGPRTGNAASEFVVKGPGRSRAADEEGRTSGTGPRRRVCREGPGPDVGEEARKLRLPGREFPSREVDCDCFLVSQVDELNLGIGERLASGQEKGSGPHIFSLGGSPMPGADPAQDAAPVASDHHVLRPDNDLLIRSEDNTSELQSRL